jgi:hypothetical protein
MLLSRRGGLRDIAISQPTVATIWPADLARASPLSLTGAIDSGAGHAEQVGELSGGVLAALEQSRRVHFLPLIELGLLTA